MSLTKNTEYAILRIEQSPANFLRRLVMINKKVVFGWEIAMAMVALAVYGGCFHLGMREDLALILASGIVFTVFVVSVPISEIATLGSINDAAVCLAGVFATIGITYGAIVAVPAATTFTLSLSAVAVVFAIVMVISDSGKIKSYWWVLTSLLGEGVAVFVGVVAISRFIGG